jgi:uncharacterized membrane protein YbaN (DUF454 family)
MTSSRVHASRPVRALFVALGTIFLALGLVGIVVPILPTTPFLLLAAACYARASERLYAWLLGQPTLGPIIERWRRSGSMAPGVKRRAMIVVVVTFAVSIVLVGDLTMRAGLVVGGAVLLRFLARIPTEA